MATALKKDQRQLYHLDVSFQNSSGYRKPIDYLPNSENYTTNRTKELSVMFTKAAPTLLEREPRKSQLCPHTNVLAVEKTIDITIYRLTEVRRRRGDARNTTKEGFLLMSRQKQQDESYYTRAYESDGKLFLTHKDRKPKTCTPNQSIEIP